MKRLFYIADIQDLWLFHPIMKKGERLIYNKTSNKCTAPHKFLDQLSDYNLIGYSGPPDSLLSLFAQADLFISKDGLPFTAAYLEKRPDISRMAKDKIVSLSWTGESCRNPHKCIKDFCKIHFCEPHFVSRYKSLGVAQISTLHPKYYMLNTISRKSACKILGLDPSNQYCSLIITSGGGAAQTGVDKLIYSTKNLELLHSIEKYCKTHNITTIQKNKLKQGKQNPGINADLFLSGDNIFYHQTLLLLAISKFSIGFSSAASIEAEVIGANYINFLPYDFNSTDIHPASLRYGTFLSRDRTTLNIEPSMVGGLESCLEFIKDSFAPSLPLAFEASSCFSTSS